MSDIDSALLELNESIYELNHDQREELKLKISSFIRGVSKSPGTYLSTPVATAPGANSGSAIKCPKCGDDLNVYLTL